jgi:hypothetical protein
MSNPKSKNDYPFLVCMQPSSIPLEASLPMKNCKTGCCYACWTYALVVVVVVVGVVGVVADLL